MNYSLVTIKNFSSGIVSFLKEVFEKPDRGTVIKNWDEQIEESPSCRAVEESTEETEDVVAEINDIASKLKVDGHRADNRLQSFASRSIEELLKNPVTVEGEKHVEINRARKGKRRKFKLL